MSAGNQKEFATILIGWLLVQLLSAGSWVLIFKRNLLKRRERESGGEREREKERKGLSAYYCPFEFDSIRFDFEFVKSVN